MKPMGATEAHLESAKLNNMEQRKVFRTVGLTEDDVRRIVREELDIREKLPALRTRVKAAKKAAAKDKRRA